LKKIIITKSVGQRIDKFLSKKYREIPRRFFQNGIKQKNFLVNGKEVSPSYRLKEKDRVNFDEMYVHRYVHGNVHRRKIEPDLSVDFKVIFEHKDFVIIEKPAGLSVHPSINKPNEKTLANGLLTKYPQIKSVGEDPLRPGIVHRLDKETSGLMIVSLNQKVFEFFKEQFKKRKVEKKYLAVIWGKITDQKGTIQTPIGKSKSDLTRQATSKNSVKLINPKKAITHWRLLEKNKETSLLEVKIDTGRKHQIRVHLHSIGHSLVGDKKYQTKLIREINKKFDRHLLHAYRLKFKYLDGKKYEFESEVPRKFNLH